ncbi:MAG: hypothetical protein L0287_05930 [Anaerolineae bacterium]|nr:hypothetical protein [Anaerolineae bacterium]
MFSKRIPEDVHDAVRYGGEITDQLHDYIQKVLDDRSFHEVDSIPMFVWEHLASWGRVWDEQ